MAYIQLTIEHALIKIIYRNSHLYVTTSSAYNLYSCKRGCLSSGGGGGKCLHDCGMKNEVSIIWHCIANARGRQSYPNISLYT